MLMVCDADVVWLALSGLYTPEVPSPPSAYFKPVTVSTHVRACACVCVCVCVSVVCERMREKERMFTDCFLRVMSVISIVTI